jgi:RNA polymerase sigma-70 factor (ECF subfamily)
MLNSQYFKSLIAKGDQKKFRLMMELTSDELLRFAIGFLKNKEISEEIISDVYVKIWNNRSKLESIKNLKSYLFISVRNGCLSYLRKSKDDKIVSIECVNEFNFSTLEEPEDESIEKEMLDQIYTAIEKLPCKCKMVFTLAKINGLKYREIAEILEITEKTVNNHLVLAVKKITEQITINKKINKTTFPIKNISIYFLLW